MARKSIGISVGVSTERASEGSFLLKESNYCALLLCSMQSRQPAYVRCVAAHQFFHGKRRLMMLSREEKMARRGGDNQ